MAMLLAFGGAAGWTTGMSRVVPNRASVAMAIEDLPGAGPETGGKVFDPLGLASIQPYGSTNYEWMRTAELKHGRVCMAASVGWIVQEAGVHWPGALTKSGVTFAELPKGLDAWAAVPEAGKLQILAACGVIELYNEVKKPHYLNAGMPTFTDRRLMAELKNGRLAMIAVASFFAASTIPGSVPLLPAGW